jgi:type II secretion system protein N
MNWPELPPLSPRVRRVLIWAGYPLWAIAVAVLTLYATVPRDRIKDKLETSLAADPMSTTPLAIGMDATIEDVGLTLFSGFGVRVKNVVLRSRPLNPNDKPSRWFVDDTTVHVGLLGLLFGKPAYSFKGHALGGSAHGKIAASLDETTMKIDADGITVTGVPSVAQAVGLPVDGVVSGKLDVVAPRSLASQANGTFEITIDDAAIGDGKTKLTVPGDPFLSQGVTFPRLRLGRVHGSVVIEKGRARIEGLAAHSPDGDVTLEGFIELRDPLSLSQLHAFLRFRPSEALLAREVTIKLLNDGLGALAKRPDGYIGFQLTGPMTAVFFLPSKDPPPGVSTRGLPTSSVSTMPAPTGAGEARAPTGMAAVPPPPPPPVAAPTPPPSGGPTGATIPPPPPPPGTTAGPIAPMHRPPPQAEADDDTPPQVRANVNKALDDLTAKPAAPPEEHEGKE